MLPGDVLYVQSYNASKPDMTPDYNKGSIAIEPGQINGLMSSGPADTNMADVPYGIGPFSTSEPDSDGFCTAPTLGVARLRQDAVVAMPNACPPVAPAPAVDMQYEFTNVRVYATAAAQGTEFSAELKYTTTDPTGATCVATYHVRALYPMVSCGAPGPTTGDDGGNDAPAASDDGGGSEAASVSEAGDDGSSEASAAGGEAGSSEAGSGDDGGGMEAAAPCDAGGAAPAAPSGPMVPSIQLCSPFADPAAGMVTGSGINPDYAVVCDPNQLLCVLAKDPPSFK
jgi:hypothetical protein